jgi:hypothetical protein
MEGLAKVSDKLLLPSYPLPIKKFKGRLLRGTREFNKEYWIPDKDPRE